MPNISFFYGIVIIMYPNDHNPPHFHAAYGGYAAMYEIESLKILHGKLPKKVDKLVKEWALKNRKEIMEVWETGKYKKIEGLM